MKLLIITQKVDKNDPILGFFHDWLLEFAARVEFITVICLEKGEYDLPKNISIYSLGKEEGRSRFLYLFYFYKIIVKERKKYNVVFVHMNPEYIVLGGLLWRLWNKKIFLWYTHRQVSLRLRLALWLSHHVFTATSESFRIPSKKVEVVGHFIDINKFYLKKYLSSVQMGRPLQIVHVGRITPIKDCLLLIDAAKRLKEEKVSFQINFIGDAVTKSDEHYKRVLIEKIRESGLEHEVHLLGSVPYKEIGEVFRKADLSVNLAPTGGADKVVFQSMSAGTPVIIHNETFLPFLGEYKEKLFLGRRDKDDLAEKIQKLNDKNILIDIGKYLSEKVHREMQTDKVIFNMIQVMKKNTFS